MRPSVRRSTGRRPLRPGAGRAGSLVGALASALALLGAGCSGMQGLLAPVPPPKPAPVVNPQAHASRTLGKDLAVINRLLTSDPVTQQEIVDRADKDYNRNPTPSRKLRLAMVLGTPGHPGADLPFARQLLKELLADPGPKLLPAERTLALLEVQLIGDHLTLEAENRTLQGQADRASSLELENHRLQAQADETLRLRQALEEARAKLAAIANIEKSLNEHKPEGRPK
jgi:hypothetical protein